MNNKYFGLHNLQSAVKSVAPKRVGRGESSGWGKTSGRGHKGQKARKSGNVRFGFEGGQTPLLRKLPKRGFYNKKTSYVSIICIDKIVSKFTPNSIIDIDLLRHHKLIKGKKYKKLKIIRGIKGVHPLVLKTDYISHNLKKYMEHIGGKIILTK